MLKYIFLSSLFFCFSSTSEAQRLQVNNKHLWDNTELTLSERDYERVVETTKEVMQQYYSNASFMDKTEGRVTQKSINELRKAFLSGAKIKDDLAFRTRDDRNFNDYSSRVLDYLRDEGVKFEMRVASIENIFYDEAGYYQAEVKTVKTIFNGLDFNDKPFRCKTGRKFFLKFIIQIEKDDLGDGGIARIAGSLQSGCKDAQSLVGLNVRYGQDFIGASGFDGNVNSLPMTTMNSSVIYEEEGKADFNMDVQSISTFSIGGSYNLPISKEEAWYLSANINYSIYNIKTDIQGTYYYEQGSDNGAVSLETPDNWNLYKYVRVTSASEKTTLQTLEIPVGVLYRKKIKGNDQFFFGTYLLFVPTIHLSQSATVNIGEEDIDYWLAIGNGETNSNLGLNTFFQEGGSPTFGNAENTFGNGNLNESLSGNSTVSAKTAFLVRISPFVHFVLDDKEKILLEVALDYTHGLTDFFEHSENGELFAPDARNSLDASTINSDISNSSTVLQTYFSKSNINTLGLRLGVIYKL